jgi:precorrin-4 methylase
MADLKNRYFSTGFILVWLLMAAWMLPSAAAAWGRGHLYVIGMGPAGPGTATLQALDTLKQMDVIVAPQKQIHLFAEYVGQKPVLFDPWTNIWDYKGKSMWELDDTELAAFKKERFRIRSERVAKIEDLLAKGKDVGLMEYGNPCLYGPNHWYSEQFDLEDIVVIPGMGCDAAAMAALKKSTIPAYDTHFVIQTSPFSLMRWGGKEQGILKDLGKYPSTMIFYMALWKQEALFKALNSALSPDTPCAVVFWAGYPGKERVLRGTVADMSVKLSKDKEKFMGLLFVGRFLEGKPYDAAMKRSQKELGKNKKIMEGH